jgi:hypothetical protein
METDPNVMQLCAHFLANEIDGVRARLEWVDGIRHPSGATKAVLQAAWRCAQTIEAKAKELRRSQEWRTWVSLRGRDPKTWAHGEFAARAVGNRADAASLALATDKHFMAVHELLRCAVSATGVLWAYGYKEMAKDLKLHAFAVGKLPEVES